MLEIWLMPAIVFIYIYSCRINHNTPILRRTLQIHLKHFYTIEAYFKASRKDKNEPKHNKNNRRQFRIISE